ncbi:hypothetical protein Metbo_1348 [Methanobacterium lacus]|jgi:hypothetical protein|uniref:Uncharacterized protein n=1 Tax=Methanobacterium lacus (strain AL-21) TaxID=877455 RepID=F0T7M0_METLA|nr:hypothetical protein Metbo_1348 [Methanobacterium lacus]
MVVKNKVCNTRKKQRRLLQKYIKGKKPVKAVEKCKI